MNNSDEERLTNLEILLTQQDDVIDTLNRLVHDQRTQMEILQEKVKNLEDKLGGGLGGSNIASMKDETPPPHY
ncbi:SlyX family protein [Leucothrix sargassi]|nr:SlyX family protein [Leucothrix sargassi]